MTIKTNLYVEKVNSEHPIAVWMLNEDVDYISLITESQRYLETGSIWSITNGVASAATSFPSDTPFPDSHTTQILTSSTPATPIRAEGNFATSIPISKFDTTLANFCISGYLYVDSAYATSIQFGYIYDTSTVTNIEVLHSQTLSLTDEDSWVYFSNTFVNPPANALNIQPLIKINLTLTSGLQSDYRFLINGLTFGQWSEEFNSKSLGLNLSDYSAPSNFISGLNVIPAVPYGTSNENAYYITGTNKLYATNFGVPLVYGSNNITKLYPNTNAPSLVFPGYGFLNQKGKYNDYTAEMWLRLNTDTKTTKRIFGPVASKDGLYVEGAFLTMVIGNKYASHYVGEWYRPMLIHIRYSKESVSVLLNGEDVISLSFLESEVSFPEEFATEPESQDWLGFYSYDDIYPLEIDSFAIYSYVVPVEVAKRRWVWGQGLVAPEQTNSALNAFTTFNDYAYSKYSVNYKYPDFGKWTQGFFSNVNASSRSLELPSYVLPEFGLGAYSLQNWYDDMKYTETASATKYFTFRPTVVPGSGRNWSTNAPSCSLYFSEFGFLNEQVSSFYGIFERSASASNETLFIVTNKINGDYIEAKLNATTITYSSSVSGIISVIGTKSITANQKFTAGLNIQALSLSNIDGVNTFFNNESLISIRIGGNNNTTFAGKLYKFGFNSQYNNRKINTLYNTVGIFSETLVSANTLMNHVANYTLEPFEKYNLFFADISSSGYWEDYMPLSYFAKYVTDYNGDSYYDLTSIQFNIDYPEALETLSAETTSSWTYDDLDITFAEPYQKTYENLSSQSFTGFVDYEDLAQNSVKYRYYNTVGSFVRSYISFQSVQSGANKSLLDYTNANFARTNGVVDWTIIPGNWETSVYEVNDGSIIYPPKIDQNDSPVDFNDYALVYHLDFNVKGILHNKVKLKSLQFASQVLERSKFTEIGTKYGIKTYPYTKNGLYYDFQGQIPISTYKGSTPHLYLNRHSGWRIRFGANDVIDRGLSIPINTQEASNFKVSGIQLWLRFSDIEFPDIEKKIFSVEFNDTTYNFYMIQDESTQRGYVYAKDYLDNTEVTDIEYYVNGSRVFTPYLSNEEWTCLSVKFNSPLDFSEQTGRLNLTGEMLYNNASFFLATNLDQAQTIFYRNWDDINDFNWDWATSPIFSNQVWSNVLIYDSSSRGLINFSDIYAKYVGTNRVIIDDETRGALFDPDTVKVYGQIGWQTTVSDAV